MRAILNDIGWFAGVHYWFLHTYTHISMQKHLQVDFDHFGVAGADNAWKWNPNILSPPPPRREGAEASLEMALPADAATSKVLQFCKKKSTYHSVHSGKSTLFAN